MLGVGWTEMLLIGVVALIIIGPKELPAVMQRIGKFAGTIRRMGSEFQRELNKTTGLNEITNLRNSVTAPLKATADAIRKEFNTVTPSGAVQPSGVIKPADPAAQSVVNEIKAAAGIAAASSTPTAAAPAVAPATPAVAATTPAPASGATAPAPGAPPAKARRPTKVSAPAESAVASSDLPAPVRRARARKLIESPAPVEAIAPASRRTVAAARTEGAGTASKTEEPVARKPSPRKKSAQPAADEKP